MLKRLGLVVGCALLTLPLFLKNDLAGAKTISELNAPVKLREEVSLKIDGVSLENAQSYFGKNGTLMIPLRTVAEALGYDVTYKKENKTIELTRQAHWIVVKLDEDLYSFGKMAPINLGTIPAVSKGRTFVPLSFVTEILNLDVKQENRNVMNIISGNKEELPFIVGKIASLTKVTDGVKVELDNEKKGYDKIFLTVDSETTIINPITNEKVASENLKVGERIRGFYGPVVAESYPPQSHTSRIEVIGDKEVKTDVITGIEEVHNDRYILVGTMENGVRLLVTEETSIVTSENKPVLVEDLQEGMKVDAFYGPIQTMSLPPMSSTAKIIIK